MSIKIAEANEFSSLFRGRDDFYGKYIPPKKDSLTGEKEKGKSITITNKLSDNSYFEHLKGSTGLGIIPINNDNKVNFSVIDIDTYPIDPKKYISLILRYDLPFKLFYSKSGGLHLYIFWSESIEAEKAIDILKRFVLLFGLPKDTEIFPKQKRVNKESAGNWINLPYFGDSRKLIDNNCETMSLQEALIDIKRSRINLSQAENIIKDLPLFDAPPCLQSLYICNDPDVYEMYLFNIAIYFKASNIDTWKDEVHNANNRLDDPLEEKRVDQQVIKSHEEKTYSYRCGEAPICSRCNRIECRKRPFGKGGDEISNFSFGDLKQVKAKHNEQPFYVWLVNEKEMKFMNEKELRDQNKFADYAMRLLHVVPNQLKNSKWIEILNNAFKNIAIEEIEDDFSKESFLTLYIAEYLRETVKAKNIDQLHQLKRVYYDSKTKEYLFIKNSIVDFIMNTKGFKIFDTREIFLKLQNLGAKSRKQWIPSKKTSIRIWYISENELDKISETPPEIDEIDFSTLEEKRF